ncbi:Phage tail protein [Paenibacillus sophorae]|uniref:Phage tail protein n=1 Tax=Paenibacillus sophorae TaxID=1333845 RepID=A0A1H8H6N3_9BACL|nr:phage tail domain-containing protein [Paenibacillus sophorae]QWU14457.1 phage tail protein [Paenibacillus sophorae]SEN51680.1 Phage tail protein [Paenibacillus sophorae]
MTIRDSLYFSYAGKKSVDYGIYNVNINGGMQEEPFAASREIQEEKIKGRDRPYFQSVEKQPLQFSVSFAFEDAWDTQKLREVTRWLTEHDYYQELYFTNELGVNPEKVYYALAVDDSTIVHNCLRQGYVNLTFRCDGAYAYSPITTSPLYKWRESTYSNNITDFSSGEKKSVIEDVEGNLVLNPHRTKWSDFSPTMKWYELDQLYT